MVIPVDRKMKFLIRPKEKKEKRKIKITIKNHMKIYFNCSVTLTSQLKETDLDSFLHIDDDVIDSIEMEMKMRLMELQKRYREKQKELQKLKPKKEREKNKEDEKGKESESLVWYFVCI